MDWGGVVCAMAKSQVFMVVSTQHLEDRHDQIIILTMIYPLALIGLNKRQRELWVRYIHAHLYQIIVSSTSANPPFNLPPFLQKNYLFLRMARTRHVFFSLQPKVSDCYFFKCKRKLNKEFSRYSHKRHRNDNYRADELHFVSFTDHKYRDSTRTSTKSGQLIGTRYRYQEFINDQFRTQIGYETPVQKLSTKIRELLYRQTEENRQLSGKGYAGRMSARHLSDLYIAAYKQLKRRGSIGTFLGHRGTSQLYKRELDLDLW